MRILCLGDVVGKIGCEAVRRVLPSLRRDKNIDLVIVNGENSAEGNGILPSSAEHLFTSGADIITGGNHTLRRSEIYDMLENNFAMLRPANLSSRMIGHGSCVYDMGRNIVGVINLSGTAYMDPADNPFDAADREIERLRQQGAGIIMVDFHAEATGEKGSLAYYLDGRVSAVFGTHTHVQTNDDCILEKGTGFISDIGMCGPVRSVLGVKPELTIEKMRNRMPVRFRTGEGDCLLCGCIFEVDDRTHLTLSTEKIRILSKSD